jgi:hypothetical protein
MKADTIIRTEGMKALRNQLGVVEAEKFITLIRHDNFDYSGDTTLISRIRPMTEYGRGWSEKQLRHCLRFADIFPDKKIVYTLCRQLSWTRHCTKPSFRRQKGVR